LEGVGNGDPEDSTDVCFTPKSGHLRRSKSTLFDHLVGAEQKSLRHRNAKRFRSLDVDDYMKGAANLGVLFIKTLQVSAFIVMCEAAAKSASSSCISSYRSHDHGHCRRRFLSLLRLDSTAR
jgi:hypothetical protein